MARKHSHSAWLNWSRRLSKNYALRRISAETMVFIAFAHSVAAPGYFAFGQILTSPTGLLWPENR
jgi:hypothetical protein